MSGRKQAALVSTSISQAARQDRIPAPRSLVDRLVPENGRLRRTMLASLAKYGMVSRRSAQELLEGTGDAELARLLDYFYDRVKSTELGEEQWTYDLSVPDNVTYVANGFVSHNTIGLLMDCDTTGVEPDFALVKFKKLAGGGYFKIVNQSVGPALDALGYSAEQRRDIIDYVMGTSSLAGAPHINRRSLRAHGFTDDELDRIEASLPEMFELRHAFNVLAVGEPTLRRLGVEPAQSQRLDFDLLAFLGFSAEQIEAAGDYVCGRHTIEGAPHLSRRAPAGVRHRQPQWSPWSPVHPPQRPYPDDGCRPAVYLRRYLQDHQHAQRGEYRRHPGRLPPVLAVGTQVHCSLSGRLQGLPASLVGQRRLRRRGRTGA